MGSSFGYAPRPMVNTPTPGPGATFLEPPRTYGIRFTMRYAP